MRLGSYDGRVDEAQDEVAAKEGGAQTALHLRRIRVTPHLRQHRAHLGWQCRERAGRREGVRAAAEPVRERRDVVGELAGGVVVGHACRIHLQRAWRSCQLANERAEHLTQVGAAHAASMLPESTADERVGATNLGGVGGVGGELVRNQRAQHAEQVRLRARRSEQRTSGGVGIRDVQGGCEGGGDRVCWRGADSGEDS